MKMIIRPHRRVHGGYYYTLHAREGPFKQILGRYKTRAAAKAAKNKYVVDVVVEMV